MQNKDRWTSIRDLFDAAMQQAASDRMAFVEASDVSPEIRREVLSLLVHAVDDSLDGLAPQGVLRPRRAMRGQRLGAWELRELLGSGGMGEVWLARRADGSYETDVAVKMLKHGLDSEAVLKRFAQERQALARLDHPNIARLLDAGISPQGLPYFVMERVRGRSIDLACARLDLNQRLELFLQLADAVAHAHRHLLVHRDLKPGNVLVSDEGQVKLLDFGIAKALDPLEGGDGEVTQAGQRPFTPSHASPEQIRGQAVSTATDVYSLGVLLYQLLTGQRPYGRDLESPADLALAALNEQPTRPSSLSAPAPEVAAEWLATRQHLRGDLDNILLKTLEKEPARRYSSVEALADDLRAHLAGYPVSARAPTTGYLMARFVTRNKLAVVLSGLTLLGVLGGAGVALWQAHVAQQQRDQAELRLQQVRQLANQLVFKYHDQIAQLPGAAKTREALLVDAAQFLDGLREASSADPKFAYELASTYYRIAQLQGIDTSSNIGEHELARQNLDKALAVATLYVDAPGMSSEALSAAINMHVSHGEVWQRSGQMAKAEAALRAGLPMLERLLARAPQDSWILGSAMSFHGVHARILGNALTHAALGRWTDACAAADRARQAAEASMAANPSNRYAPDSLAFTLGEQAHCALFSARFADAIGLLRRQVELRDLMAERFPDDMDFRYQRAIARAHLARALSASGAHEQALRYVDEALEMTRSAVATDAGNQAGARRIVQLQAFRLQFLVQAGQQAQVQAGFDTVLPQLPARPALGFAGVFSRADNLIWAARAWHPQDAAKALRLAEEAAQLLQGDDDNATRRWMLGLALGEQAQALQSLGRSDEAKTAARAALEAWKAQGAAEAAPPLLKLWMDAARALAGA